MPAFRDQDFDGYGVRLRALRAGDVPDIAAACVDDECQRWLMLPYPYTEDTAREFVGVVAAQDLTSGSGIHRAIEVDGVFMGVVGLQNTNWAAASTEAGYWLGPWARGRGIAARALSSITAWALDSQGMGRVEVRVAPDNLASLGAARRSLFVEEGTLRRAGVTTAGPTDLVVLSRLYDDPRPQFTR